MKTVLSLLFSALFLFSAQLQSQTYLWARSGGGNSGDYGNAVAVDAAGNSYVTGWFQQAMTLGSYTLISNGFYDVFVAKYDPNGNVVWATSAGSGANDIGYGISLDAVGGIYVGGTFSGSVFFGSNSVTSSNSSADAFVAKLSPSGTWLWVRAGGSTVDDQAQCIDVNGSTVALSGYFKSSATFSTGTINSYGNSDIFVAKYDTAGNFQWVRGGGGTSYEIAYGVTVDPSGNIYSNGYFRGTATFGIFIMTSTGGDDAILLQYSPTGTCMWAKKGGGTGDDKGLGVTSDANGIYATGWFVGNATFETQGIASAGSSDVYVVKYNTAGTLQWISRAGGVYADGGYGIAASASGSLWVTGSFDTTAQFGPVMVNSFGGTDVFIARLSASTGVFNIASSGGAQAATIFQKDIGYGIGIDGSGMVYAIGAFQNTATWGPFFTTSVAIQDFFLVKLDQTTGIQGSDHNAFYIYPNPAKDHISIMFPDAINKNAQVRIYGIDGKILVEHRSVDLHSGTQIEIPISHLSPGIYFVETNDGVARTSLFIKE